VADKRLVAVCDILGFKELIKNRDLHQLIDGDLSLFRRLVGFSLNHGEAPQLPPALNTIREQNRVGFAWFSDTLFLYAKDDGDLSCQHLLESVAWLLFNTMWTPTRLRGGIGYGDFYAEPENELYVGPAILEAYELEQSQQWAGAALTDNAANRIPSRTTSGERFQWWVCQYSVPVKHDTQVRCSNLAIDWTQGIHKKVALKWSSSCDEPTEAEKLSDKSVCQKWANTRLFHEDICISCFSENKTRDPLKVI
jgi:hypothetical protein